MPMPIRSATFPKRNKINFVKEQARTRISKTAAKKDHVPGYYAQHHPDNCDHKLRSRPIHLKLEKPTEGKEILKVIARDNIRDLLVPDTEINVYPAIWQRSELERLQSRAKVVTMEDRLDQIEMSELEKKRMMEESEKRKQILKDIDKKKIEQSRTNKNVDESHEEVIRILDKVVMAKQEQEEEIKKANRIILTTKCQIIRDAQIAEKNEIEKEIREEDLRLEKMMNDDREKALKDEDIKKDKQKKTNAIHSLEIQNQLRQRELTKLLEAERIEDEAKAMARAQIAITMDMIETEKKRKERMAKIKYELQKANELSEFFKRLEFEEQRIAELKVQEYMRKRYERDAQIAIEKRLANEQKEREKERMLRLQQKLLESKSAQNEMGMRREEEEKEREFRKREKDAVLRKINVEKELAIARSNQLEEVKRSRAIQIARDEADFKKMCEKLAKFDTEEKKKLELKLKNNTKYRSEIINQMNERELKRRELERKAKNDLHANQEAERNRIRTIKNVLSNKIQEMKRNKVDSKFIINIERQLKSVVK